MMFKNKIGIITVVVLFLFIKCENKTIVTTIKEVDRKHVFTDLEVFTFDKDSMYPHVELFYIDKLKDSVYVIGTKQIKNYIVRARGWSYKNNKVGDWFYEKMFDDLTNHTDSILNFIPLCGEYVINTVKKFQDNSLDKYKGYAYETSFKKNSRMKDTVEIRMEFVYDTVLFKKISNELYLYNPQSIEDYCTSSEYVIDSFPIVNNTVKMNFLMNDMGKIKILGYYYLLNKQDPNDKVKRAQKVFTEINLEVRE